MKKFLGIIILPLMALIMLCGCGSDKSTTQVKTVYSEMVSMFAENNNTTNKLFSDTSNPNSLKLVYPTSIRTAINNENPTTKNEKMYRGLYYQQLVLDNIYRYYENNQEDFYTKTSNGKVNKDKINSLYESALNLKNQMADFERYYDNFIAAIESNKIMDFNITTYSFRINEVIDASFEFMYKMHEIYKNDCLENYNTNYNEKNLKVYIDKAYLDFARIIYLENIRACNYSVGTNGDCDLSYIVANNVDHNYLYILLENNRELKFSISENIGDITSEQGVLALDKLNNFVYSRNVFEQRLNNYLISYNELDHDVVIQYRFGLNEGVSYDSYLNSLSPSNRSTLIMLDNFLEDNFMEYVANFNIITEVRT